MQDFFIIPIDRGGQRVYNNIDQYGQCTFEITDMNGGEIIFSKFLNLNVEKRERIINAALKVFAQKGYENASTNEIVKEANISKGLLFHYFNNKKDLFLFLYEFSLETLVNEYFNKIDPDEKDLFIKIRQGALLKLELFKKYPQMYDFIVASYYETSSEVKDEIQEKNEKYTDFSLGKIYENIDMAKFKEDVDIKKAMNIIFWTIEGYANRQQEKFKKFDSYEMNFNEMLAEVDVYFDMLKKCFYK